MKYQNREAISLRTDHRHYYQGRRDLTYPKPPLGETAYIKWLKEEIERRSNGRA